MPLENNMNLRLFASLSPCKNKYRCLLPTSLRRACCQNSPVRANLPLRTHHSFHKQIFFINLSGFYSPSPPRSLLCGFPITFTLPYDQLAALSIENVKYCSFLVLPQITPCLCLWPRFLLWAQTNSLVDIDTWKSQKKMSQTSILNIYLFNPGVIQCMTPISILGYLMWVSNCFTLKTA